MFFRPLEWRSLAANLGFVPAVCAVPSTFNRDLKHLDQTKTREVHKVGRFWLTSSVLTTFFSKK